MVGHTLALLRYGYNGQSGVEHALDLYREAYRGAVCADRDGGEGAADNEFERAVRGAGGLLLLDLSFDVPLAVIRLAPTPTASRPTSIPRPRGAAGDGYESYDAEDGAA